jgi:Putative beta-barrel porin-2, OmpL-like. bbp2
MIDRSVSACALLLTLVVASSAQSTKAQQNPEAPANQVGTPSTHQPPNASGVAMAAETGGTSSSRDGMDAPAANASPAASVHSALIGGPGPGFFARWGKAYLADWTSTTAVDPNAPKRRETPPPIASPPFPGADWPIGGTQEIGAPDYQTYMLQTAFNHGDPTRLSAIKWYGWIAVGGNASTNNRGNAQSGVGANAPLAYDVFPNTIVLDQLALYTEKLADTVQRDHFDWGFRLTSLYGQDYRYTTSHGILSQQLLVKNQQYGYDPVMAYADLYFPRLGQGSDLRIGRYISLPDIEAQLAPNNYSYSHSILYTYDCYTQVGANLTTKVNDNWTIQEGISAGCDTAPWTHDAKVTGNVCLVYGWHVGKDTVNLCDNTINDGKYAYNNLTAFYLTWYHGINDHWHTDSEFWYQYMTDVPNMWWYNNGIPAGASTPWPENVANNHFLPNGSTPSTLNFGAVCEDPRVTFTGTRHAYCYAPEWAFTNYLEHNFRNNTASLNIRNEVVNDIKGQRTGTPAIYEEHMVGFDFWTGTTVTFRPELSYVRSFSPYGLRALDIQPGSSVAAMETAPISQTPFETMQHIRAKTQALVLAGDLIWHF